MRLRKRNEAEKKEAPYRYDPGLLLRRVYRGQAPKEEKNEIKNHSWRMKGNYFI